MNSDQFVKYRAMAVVAIASICYPIVLLLASLIKVYQLLFGKSKCKPLAGDVAVITGAGHGLGRCIAIELAKKGCHIAVVDINYEGALETHNMINKRFNVKSKAYEVDVTNYEQIVKLNEYITNDLGTATIVVNNAGVLMFDNVNNPDPKDVQRMINVNLTAHFWMNRVFVPNMKRLRRGHITAISSAMSFFPVIFNSEYTSTKFGVRGMMRALRQELKYAQHDNINCTTVFPMFLQTNTRVNDLAIKCGYNEIYPMISGEEAAERIVQAMQNCEEEIVLPNVFAFLYRCYEILPSSWQDFMLLFLGKPLVNNFVEYKQNCEPGM